MRTRILYAAAKNAILIITSIRLFSCLHTLPQFYLSQQGLTVAFVESMTTQLQNFPNPPGPTDPFW